MRQTCALILGATAAMFSVGCGGSDSGGDKDAGSQDVVTDLGSSGNGYDAPTLTAKCTSGDPDSTVIDISGTWAWRTVGTRLVQASGMPPFRTRAISYMLATHTVTGSAVTVNATYCDRTEVDDASALVKVVIPQAWRDTHSQLQRSGTFADSGNGVMELNLPRFIELWGVDLANPDTDALPTDVNDPRLVDCDNDQRAGLSIALTGLFNVTMQVCQRQYSTMIGYATSPTRIEGQYVLETEQTILAPPEVKNLPQTTIADPVACNSNFVMVKVSASETCDSLRVKGDELFW